MSSPLSRSSDQNSRNSQQRSLSLFDEEFDRLVREYYVPELSCHEKGILVLPHIPANSQSGCTGIHRHSQLYQKVPIGWCFGPTRHVDESSPSRSDRPRKGLRISSVLYFDCVGPSSSPALAAYETISLEVS